MKSHEAHRNWGLGEEDYDGKECKGRRCRRGGVKKWEMRGSWSSVPPTSQQGGRLLAQVLTWLKMSSSWHFKEREFYYLLQYRIRLRQRLDRISQKLLYMLIYQQISFTLDKEIMKWYTTQHSEDQRHATRPCSVTTWSSAPWRSVSEWPHFPPARCSRVWLEPWELWPCSKARFPTLNSHVFHLCFISHDLCIHRWPTSSNICIPFFFPQN